MLMRKIMAGMHVNLHQQQQPNVDGIVQGTIKPLISRFFISSICFFFFSRGRTPPSPRSPVSRSGSRSSVEGSKSPPPRKEPAQRSPSPRQSSSSSSKRRRNKEGGDSGRHICEICHEDVEGAKRLFGVLDNCDHVL